MTDRTDNRRAATKAGPDNAAAATGNTKIGAAAAPLEDGITFDATPSNVAEAELTEEAQRLIGLHLKQLYGRIVAEPVPDEFVRLLDELEQKERGP